MAAEPEIDVVRAAQLVENGEAFLVDVREEDEWQAGHASEATHLPMGEIADRLGELPAGRTILPICRSGNRSGQVAAALRLAGYDASNVRGGMKAWRSASLPLEPGNGRIA